MNLPCFVFPYQRSPSRWYTFVSVFTHTIPFTGGCCAGWEADSVLAPRAGAALAAGCGAGAGSTSRAAGGGGAYAWRAGAAACAPTVTSGVIFSIVLLGTPA